MFSYIFIHFNNYFKKHKQKNKQKTKQTNKQQKPNNKNKNKQVSLNIHSFKNKQTNNTKKQQHKFTSLVGMSADKVTQSSMAVSQM